MSKILLIEDEEAMLGLLKQILEGDGHQVFVASNGQDGMRRFFQESPDIVVTDVMMPGKDGLEVIREIIHEKPTVKVIAMSGSIATPRGNVLDSGLQLGMAQDFGAHLVLAKPFSPQRLREAITELLAAQGEG